MCELRLKIAGYNVGKCWVYFSSWESEIILIWSRSQPADLLDLEAVMFNLKNRINDMTLSLTTRGPLAESVGPSLLEAVRGRKAQWLVFAGLAINDKIIYSMILYLAQIAFH